ncbi:alpha/beta fold hydrolase [Bacillus songklensis]|uniref:Alpha/beta fold hydrolase n=1 Tax=Bacillus songklensis TaxID=1069116 RepID=A0ABV8B703_9BACI
MPKVLVNGMTMNYEVRGTGKPVLFIHGSGVSWKMWEPQIESLSERYEMMMIDMRGHGESSKIFPNNQYSMRVLAEDVKHFLDAMGISRISIVGLSQGGVVSSLFAVQYPEYVEKLVLSNSYSEVPKVAGWVLHASNAIFKWLPYELILKLILMPYGRDEYTKKIIRDSISVDKEMLLAMKTSEFPEHTNELHKITAPTLVMVGDKKNIGPEVQAGEIIFKHIPDAALAIFKDAFDPLSTMRRDIFNEMVLDFLDGKRLKQYDGITYEYKD